MSSREAAQSQTDYCVSWWPATVPRGLRFKPGVSLVASTGGGALLPLYAQSLFPKTIVSRPLQGVPSMFDLVVSYSRGNS